LNLVTTANDDFFEDQLGALRRRGVRSETLAVPGERELDADDASGRSVFDYLRFVPTVIGASFGDFDLIHANYGLTAPAALVQPNLPVVLSLWGSDLMGQYGWLSKQCATRCDAVVVMSEEMAAQLPCNSTVIPHGVNLDRFRPTPQWRAREELGWSRDGHHVLFPYSQERDVKDHPRARRVVDGARAALESEVTLRTVSGVPYGRMPLYYNAADCLLLTSSREGSPNSVKEAMACNVPVVSTDVGDVGERLDGVTHSHVCETDGELVDALVSVLQSGSRSNGREAVEGVTSERTARELEALYRRVLDR
jgi:glycosyltransferase involved in cell wall biosynthesis